MLPPLTLIDMDGSGLGAGPATTAPVVMLYWLPWQGQSMVPLLTWLTRQPMCVQIALNALNSPAVGWGTTTFDAVMISPPPTGTLLVLVRALATLPPPEAPLALLAGAALLVPAAGVVAAGACTDVLLEL